MPKKELFQSATIFTVLSLLVLYLGYALNLWRAADFRLYTDGEYAFMEHPEILGPNGLPDSLLTFDRFSESLVIGRLRASRARGLLSEGGFVGWLTDTPAPPDGVDEKAFKHAYQYKVYLQKGSDVPQAYQAYQSQIGGQAFMLGILDSALPFPNAAKLRLYYHLMAFLSAGAVTLILLWFFKEFGPAVGWFLTVCFSLLCYPTLYARSLWWVLWAFYIPFVAMLYVYRREERTDSALTHRRLFALVLLAMLLKLFFNGCEYITATILMALAPQCYYAIKNRWALKRFLHRGGVSLGACVLAVGISFLIVSVQFVLAEGTFSEGIDYIYSRFLVRTHGEAAALTEELGARGPSSLFELLRWYFTVPAVFDFRKMGVDRIVGMKSLMALYLTVTVGWAFVRFRWGKAKVTGRVVALILTCWLSLLAPCSWLVVFKGHSDVHRTLVGIVWYMPFMFYAMALVGVSLDALIRRGRIAGREGSV